MKTRILSIFVIAILITMFSCKPKSVIPVDCNVDYDSISQLIIQFNIESDVNSVLVCDLTDRVISYQAAGVKFNQVNGDIQLGSKSLCNKMNSNEISFLCDSLLRNFQPVDYCSKSIDDVNSIWSDDVIVVADSDRYNNRILVVFKDGNFKEFSLHCRATTNQSRLIKFLITMLIDANPDSQSVQNLRALMKKYK
jgi:hypothetical protein